MDRIGKIKETIHKVCDNNYHVRLLQMRIEDIREGETKLSMPVIEEIHGNLYGRVHGGALASLVDTTMGLACSTLGKKVVTLDLNINYIYSADFGERVTATAKVVHNGKTTMVVEAEQRDSTGRLMTKARGTFFVVGQFDIS